MNLELSQCIFCAGVGQLCVLVASALVPIRLDWKTTLAPLPPLVRQLFWVYGGYVVLSIIGLGSICITYSEELAAGGNLARGFLLYATLFWGIRLSLQAVLKSRPFLTTWWLRCGDHLLTILFTSFTLILGWGVLH